MNLKSYIFLLILTTSPASTGSMYAIELYCPKARSDFFKSYQKNQDQMRQEIDGLKTQAKPIIQRLAGIKTDIARLRNQRGGIELYIPNDTLPQLINEELHVESKLSKLNEKIERLGKILADYDSACRKETSYRARY